MAKIKVLENTKVKLGKGTIHNKALESLEVKYLVSSGKNSNGSWEKWSDGELICKYEKSVPAQLSKPWGSSYYISGGVWTFPMQFIEPPILTGSSVSINGSFASTPPSKTGVTDVRWLTYTQTQFSSSIIIVKAIGRWK